MIDDIDHITRQAIFTRYVQRKSRKAIMKEFGISYDRSREVIDTMKAQDVAAKATVWDAVILPGWQTHGELTADQARLYPQQGVSSCRSS